MTYADKAQLVLGRLATSNSELQPLSADGTFLDFLTGLLKTLLPTLLTCFGGVTGAAKQLQAPGPLVRARLRMQIRHHLPDAEASTLLADPIYHAVLAVASETTESEVKEMMAS